MSGGNSFNPILVAVTQLLKADTTLMSQVTGVFNFVPDNQLFPYVCINTTSPNQYQTMDRYGQDVTINVDVYGQTIGPNAYQGSKQINDIMNSVQRLLSRTFFPIIGWSNLGCVGTYSNTLQNGKGLTYQGVMRFELKVLQEYSPDY